MSEPSKRASSHPTVRNETTGTISGPVIQTGSIQGDIHLHTPHRPGLFWPATSALITFAVTIVLAVGVWNIAPGERLAVTAGVVAIGAAVLLLVAWLLWKRLQGSVPTQSALNRLRTQVRTQWSNEAANRGLHRPRPLRLRWRPTSSPVERAYADTEHPDADLIRGELVQADDDLNSANALASAFQDMSRRQLVVLGPPGAGKSTLAVLFTLAVINQDTDEGPVPVLLSIAGWDPAERIEDWCVRRIAEDYPGFGVNGTFNPNQVSDLLLNRRIVPVLDGLDEMPRPALGTALADLDRAAEIGLRMVLTCRSTEFEQAVHDRGALSHAAVMDIESIRLEDTAAYLTEPEVANTRRWSAVIEQMRKEPTGPLSHALSTPLMINLARSIYLPSSRNPEELAKFTTTTEITNHLLKKYLPTAFTASEHDKVQHWLSFLSHHLHEKGDPNFEWWHLARAVPNWLLILPIVLFSTMLGSLLFGLASVFYLVDTDASAIDNPWKGAAFGAILGATVGFLGGLRTARSLEASTPPIPHLRWFGLLSDSLSIIRSLVIIFCFLGTLIIIGGWIADGSFVDEIAFIVAMTLFKLGNFSSHAWLEAVPTALLACQATLVITLLGFRSGTPKRSTPQARRLLSSMTSGLALGLACAAVWVIPELMAGDLNYSELNMSAFAFVAILVGMPMGIVRWLAVPIEEHKASSPISVLRGDRTALITAALSSGVFTALGFIAFTIDERGIPGLTIYQWGLGGVIGLAIMAVVVVGSGSTWLSYTVARLYLACRGWLPWRLVPFLRTAHKKGVLRQIGPAYQLRHELLRTHLAGQWPLERHSSLTRWFSPHWLGVRRRPRARVHLLLFRAGTLAAAVFIMGTASVRYFDGDVLPLGTEVNTVAFSPDSRTVAVTAGQRVHLWDVAGRNIRDLNATLTDYDGSVGSVLFSPNSNVIATTSNNYEDNKGTVQLWNTTTGQPTTEPLTHNNSVESVKFSPDSNLIATTGYTEDDNGEVEGTVQLWNTTTGQPTTEPLTIGALIYNNWVGPIAFNPNTNPMESVLFSPDSNLIATTTWDYNDGKSTVQLWDTTTGQPTTDPLTHNNSVESVKFSPDSNLIATTSNNYEDNKGTVQLWNTTTGQPTTEPLTHNNSVGPVAFNSEGTTLATTSNNYEDNKGTVQLWNTTTGQPTTDPLTHNGRMTSVLFSPNGTTIATATLNFVTWDYNEKGIVQLWNTTTGQPITDPLTHNNSVGPLLFSPNSNFFATTTWDYNDGKSTVQLWNTTTGQPTTDPLTHNNSVGPVAFNSEGTTLATTSNNHEDNKGTVQLWNTTTGQPTTDPLTHNGLVTSVAFSPNGTTIATGSDDGTARLWEFP
ncbi:hypothetical protein Q8791_16990 [Nocardiopsis sp. CT-R113]|uniref:WD40 repeat n=1 Tax=Nocardiopsis codii TaxID=3065942 RepID=A0ABU7K9K1_9ACTN|nr:hypothetical protein [Nocardiopsis sp. CT-R113]MEE2038916.1 hypothetical protein [Nocardiopsis sp. CT-R113]